MIDKRRKHQSEKMHQKREKRTELKAVIKK
jgi:hypothetical protein